jgi:membrane-associated phospholipid phosphatase
LGKTTPPAADQDLAGTIACRLPRGLRHAVCQAAVWASFSVAYEAARGLAAGSRAEALDNAHRVLRLEQHLGSAFELDLQRPVLRSENLVLLQAVNWTYWLSQFVVVMIAIVWIYLRRPDAYPRLRNTIIVANTIGLAGYVLFPLAPPRLLPGHEFVDTLARTEPLNHRTGIVELFANPYAAMPSLHAADALIVGAALGAVVRPRILRITFSLWPVWVSYALLASGNHFWLDIAAGVALAAFAGWLTGGTVRRAYRRRRRRSRPRTCTRVADRLDFMRRSTSSPARARRRWPRGRRRRSAGIRAPLPHRRPRTRRRRL